MSTYHVTKRRFPGVLACLLCSALVSGAVAGDAPRLVCASPEYDFGTSESLRSVTHTFVLQNTGAAPLKIKQVHGCCGASTELGASTIRPGSETTLKITLSLVGRSGALRKSFYVVSNDPTQPYYQLQMIGAALADIEVTPRSVDFGCIETNSAVQTNVTVAWRTNITLTVTNVLSTTNRFAVNHRHLDGRNAVEVTIKTIPPLGFGVTRGRIVAQTDHPQHKAIEVDVVAAVASDIVPVPREIVLQEQTGTPRPETRYLAMRSRSGTPFTVLEVKTPDADMTVETNRIGAAGYRMTLKGIVPFESLDGKDLVIRTDNKTCSRVVIPFRFVEKQGPP